LLHLLGLLLDVILLLLLFALLLLDSLLALTELGIIFKVSLYLLRVD
jgi:hypothetical protein